MTQTWHKDRNASSWGCKYNTHPATPGKKSQWEYGPLPILIEKKLHTAGFLYLYVSISSKLCSLLYMLRLIIALLKFQSLKPILEILHFIDLLKVK